MPDYTNLMFLIAIVVLSINAMLMVVPNPATGTYGFAGADKNMLEWFAPSQVTTYANVHDFTGQSKGSLDFSKIPSVDSGASQLSKIPIIGPIVDWFTEAASFALQLFFGILIALSAAGVPGIIVFAIGVPLTAIEIFGVVYLLILIASVIWK